MSRSDLIVSISKKLAESGTSEELEFLRELWKSEERSASGLYEKLRINRQPSTFVYTRPNLQDKTTG